MIDKIKKFFNWNNKPQGFPSEQKYGKPKCMPDEDYMIIFRYASGYDSLKSDAVKIYRYYLRTNRATSRDTYAMAFMAEVDHPIPDPNLREYYRKKLLQEGASSK